MEGKLLTWKIESQIKRSKISKQELMEIVEYVNVHNKKNSDWMGL